MAETAGSADVPDAAAVFLGVLTFFLRLVLRLSRV